MPHRGRDVYPRGKRWWCLVRPADGKGEGTRRSTGLPLTEPREAALAKQLEYQRRAREGYAAWSSKALTLAIDGFIKDLKRRKRSEETQKTDRRKAGHFLRIWGTTVSLNEITAKLVTRFIEKRESEGMAPLTIRRELDVLRGILKWARHEGDFDRDPVLVLPLDYAPEYKPITRFLTVLELEQLLDELEPHRAAQVAFMVGAGARRSESFKARRRDVNFKELLVLVRGTKTEYSFAEIPITPLQERWLRFSLEHAPGKDVLFESWGNLSRDLTAACARLSTCMKHRAGGELRPVERCKVCKAATFENVTPNDFRRTLGNWLRDAGIAPHDIGKMLRHKDSTMAELVYARGTSTGLRDRLNERLAFVRQTVREPRHAATPQRNQRKKSA